MSHTTPALDKARRFTGAALIAATLATGGLGYVLTHDVSGSTTVAVASTTSGGTTASNASTTNSGATVTTTTQSAQTSTKGS